MDRYGTDIRPTGLPSLDVQYKAPLYVGRRNRRSTRRLAFVLRRLAGSELLQSICWIWNSTRNPLSRCGVRLPMGYVAITDINIEPYGYSLIGIAGAVALTRAMKSWLFGVGPTDPLTSAAMALLLVGVALL